jgi:hypothetical protein
MAEFTFQMIQYGYWGKSRKSDKNGNPKLITIKAATLMDAEYRVAQRKDHHKRLANGDSVTWEFVGYPL